MVILILIFVLFFLGFIAGLIHINPRTPYDDEEQIQAIEQWKEHKRNA